MAAPPPLGSADLAAMNVARDNKPTQRAVPKGAWSKEEDETVMRLVGLYGPTRYACNRDAVHWIEIIHISMMHCVLMLEHTQNQCPLARMR